MNAPDEDVAVQDGVPRTASSRHLGQSLAPAEDGHKPGNDDHVVCERNLSTLLANLADQTSRADAAEARIANLQAENDRLRVFAKGYGLEGIEASLREANDRAETAEAKLVARTRDAAALARVLVVIETLAEHHDCPHPSKCVVPADVLKERVDAALADPKA